MVRVSLWARHIIELHTAQLKWSIASWRWSASGIRPTQFDAKEHGIAIRWSQDSRSSDSLCVFILSFILQLFNLRVKLGLSY